MLSRANDKSEKGIFFIQKCAICSKVFDVNTHVISCSSCGGLIEFSYDLPSLADTNDLKTRKKSKRGLGKYSDLLPLVDSSNAVFESPAYSTLYPTPLYKSERLGSAIGARNLWLKDESKNPTRTFKDRDAVLSVSRFQELGITDFIVCTTGNSGAAFSYAIRYAKKTMRMHLFIQKGTVIDFPIHAPQIPKLEFVPGSYYDAIEAAQEYSKSTGIPYEGGFRNPCRIEGNKTLAFEIIDSGLSPDWYVQAVASGTGLCGFQKAYSEFQELRLVKKIPRILAAQAENCAPIVNAFKEGADAISERHIVDEPITFATTLANGNPWFSYPYVRKSVIDSHGDMVKVSETEIGAAQVQFLKLEGMIVDPAVAVALAGLAKSVRLGTVDRDAKILLNVSGGIRPPEPAESSR